MMGSQPYRHIAILSPKSWSNVKVCWPGTLCSIHSTSRSTVPLVRSAGAWIRVSVRPCATSASMRSCIPREYRRKRLRVTRCVQRLLLPSTTMVCCAVLMTACANHCKTWRTLGARGNDTPATPPADTEPHPNQADSALRVLPSAGGDCRGRQYWWRQPLGRTTNVSNPCHGLPGYGEAKPWIMGHNASRPFAQSPSESFKTYFMSGFCDNSHTPWIQRHTPSKSYRKGAST